MKAYRYTRSGQLFMPIPKITPLCGITVLGWKTRRAWRNHARYRQHTWFIGPVYAIDPNKDLYFEDND